MVFGDESRIVPTLCEPCMNEHFIPFEGLRINVVSTGCYVVFLEKGVKVDQPPLST